jgi:hypothetical protein
MDLELSPCYSTNTLEQTAQLTAARPSLQAHANFEHAVARHGCAEHEWLQPEVGSGNAFNRPSARMLVRADRCAASTDDQTIELELVIRSGSEPTIADILYRLPAGSSLSAEDVWNWPIIDAIADDTERRVRVELPAGRTTITCRLGQSGRLSIRLVNPTT